MTLFYIAIWIALVNISIFISDKFTQNSSYKFLAWLAGAGSALALGWGLDNSYSNYPHDVYSQWEFYVIFLSISLLFSSIGVVIKKMITS